MNSPASANGFPVDDYDLDGFARIVAGFGQHRFGYVVTPNADHLIRWYHDDTFRRYYADASYVVLDSRFMAALFRWFKGQRAGVCPGSDLTERLFSRVIAPEDAVVLIGCDEEQVRQLRERYGLSDLRHFNPPMGFDQDPTAIEECLAFIERQSPFRFCLIAVGTPRGEMLAHALHARGTARGLTLCIGAAVNFLTGKERRAPVWVRRLCLEWLYRLLRDPARLAHRYLVRGPRVFPLIARTRLVVRLPQ